MVEERDDREHHGKYTGQENDRGNDRRRRQRGPAGNRRPARRDQPAHRGMQRDSCGDEQSVGREMPRVEVTPIGVARHRHVFPPDLHDGMRPHAPLLLHERTEPFHRLGACGRGTPRPYEGIPRPQLLDLQHLLHLAVREHRPGRDVDAVARTELGDHFGHHLPLLLRHRRRAGVEQTTA